MKCEVSFQDAGKIRVLTVHGKLDPTMMLAVIAEQKALPANEAVRGMLVDFSDTTLDHMSTSDLQSFSMARNVLRESHGDDRPTAIVAPVRLVRGLTNVAAALDRSPVLVCEGTEEARKWLREQIDT